MDPTDHDKNDLDNGPLGGHGPTHANGGPPGGEGWLRSVLEHSSEVVKVVDPDGTLRYASAAFGRVFGHDPGEAVGRMNVLDHVHPDDLPRVLEETERATAVGGTVSNRVEYRFRHADGSWRWVESVGTYLPDDPAVRGVVVSVRDVTRRKEAEEDLRRSEAEIFGVLESITDGFFALDQELRFSYVNPQAALMLGRGREDLVGERLWEDDTFYPQYRRAVAEGKTVEFEGYYPPLKRWYGVRAYPSRTGLSVYFQDVTERKVAEEKIRLQAQMLGEVGEGVVAVDGDGRVAYWNRAAEDLYGWPAEEAMGRRLRDMVVPEGLRGRAEEVMAEVRAGKAWSGEFVVRRRDGTRLTVEATNTPVFDGEGGSPSVISVFRDVTQRKEAEQRLRESEERHRTLVETVPAVTYTNRADDGAYPDLAVYTSPQIEALVGFSVGEWLDPGRNLWEERLHSGDRGRVLAADGRSRSTGEPFAEEYRLVAKDGSVVWVRDEAALTKDEAGKPLYWQGVIHDITGRKEAEAALREAKERFRRSFDDAAIGMALVGTDGRFLRTNRSLCEILGYPEDDLLGKAFQELTHPEDLEKDLDNMRQLLVGEVSSYQMEKRYLHSRGHMVWALLSVSLVRGEGGEPMYFVSQIQDVSERKTAEEALREAEERYRTLVEQMPAVTYVQQATAPEAVTYVSPQMEDLLGYKPEECTSDPQHWVKVIHPEDRGRVLAEEKRSNETGDSFSMEYRQFAKDGRVVWVRDDATLVRDDEGKPLYWLGIQTDVTESRLTEARLGEAEARYRSLVEQVPVAIYRQETDHNGAVSYISPQIEAITGYAPEEYADPNLWVRTMHPDDRQRVLDEDERTDWTGEPFRVEFRKFTRDGRLIWLRDEAVLVRDSAGEPLYWQGVVQDVTERKALEERLKHQALHDPLTGLPNRRLFVDRLSHALGRTRRRRGRKVAVLFMDLDGFKNVNDSLGHEVGDLLLVAAAERLKRRLRPEDTLARFGGDEFVVLVEDVENPDEAVRVAERVVGGFGGPFRLEGRELYARASIGIATGDARTKTPEDLLRDADTAMYRAKDGGLGYSLFDPAMHERALGRLELENDLRRAIEEDEFVVHYQPIVRLDDRSVRGVEALVRWRHPERGLLNPDEFVPVAEESGLVVPMGEAVLGEACRKAKGWREAHPQMPPLVLSVNVSARQLARPDLAQTVEAVLGRTGFEGDCLDLDVTETVYVKALEGNTGALDRLRASGVRISIDDFGMGYSSLSYLKRLPADVLKVDKSFVRGLGEDAEDTAIVGMVVGLAHTLGMEVVAEGVETEGQAELLREMGCDMAQGYYFSRPLPPEDVPEFLEARPS